MEKIVVQLIKSGANINVKGVNNDTPIILVAGKGNNRS